MSLIVSSYPSQNYSITYSVLENSWSHDLVFLNGNLATRRWWIPTTEALKPLTMNHSKKGRFIFLELPGCGDSSEITGDLDAERIASDYLKILKILDVKQAGIIGHSTGGLIACLMMAQNTTLFKSSLLLDPVGANGINFDDSVLGKYQEMKTDRALTAFIIAYTIHNCDTESAYFQNVIVEDTLKSVKNVGSKMILALRGVNFENKIKNIKTPTTVLFGEKDILLPKVDALKLTQLISNSEFIEVPGAGHCLNVENPIQMAEFIKARLS